MHTWLHGHLYVTELQLLVYLDICSLNISIMPKCAGPGYKPGDPVKTCPFNRDDNTVRFSQGDMFLCQHCDNARYGTGDSKIETNERPSEPKLVICEVLCFINNTFHTFPHTQIKVSMLDVYSADEVSAAKQILHNAALAHFPATDLPRNVKRAKSANRLRYEIEDLFQLYTVLDERKIIKSLPTFVAVRMLHAPTIDVEENDTRILSIKVNKLKDKLNQLINLFQNNQYHPMPSDCVPSAPISSLETNTKQLYESRCDIPSTVETMTHPIRMNETHPKQVITSEPHPPQNSEQETDPKLLIINETDSESSSSQSTNAETADVERLPWNTVVKKSPKKRSADIQLKTKQTIVPDSLMKIKAASVSPPARNQKQPVKKAVFNIDNLDCAVTTEDMQNYLHDINIKTVSIFACKSWVTDKGVTAMRVFYFIYFIISSTSIEQIYNDREI